MNISSGDRVGDPRLQSQNVLPDLRNLQVQEEELLPTLPYQYQKSPYVNSAAYEWK